MIRSDVSVGRRNLSGTLFAPEHLSDSRSAVLFVHGRGSSRGGYAHRATAMVEALEAVCLTFDLVGHGHSNPGSGPWRLRDHLDDVVDGYDFLINEGRAESARVGVCGASYGAYLAGRLAGIRRVSRLLLRAPALYADDAIDQPFDQLAAGMGLTSGYFTALRESGSDLLIVESGNDEVIPHSTIEEYLQHCPEAGHEVIPDAHHALERPEWDDRFIDIMIRWFTEL